MAACSSTFFRYQEPDVARRWLHSAADQDIRIWRLSSSYITGRSNHQSAYRIHLEMGEHESFELKKTEKMNGKREGSRILNSCSDFSECTVIFLHFFVETGKPKETSPRKTIKLAEIRTVNLQKNSLARCGLTNLLRKRARICRLQPEARIIFSKSVVY